MSDHLQLSASQVRKSLMRCFETQQPVMIWGPPGIGKSELVAGIASDMNAPIIDLRLGQMEPTDIRGIPFFNKELGMMDWAAPVDLPTEEFAAEHPAVVLFLDELNSAPPSVLAAAYQLILNRRVGKYALPENVVLVAAGNREGDKGVTFRMPTPLANRFIHFEMKVSAEDWFEWAVQNGIHKDIVGFLNFSKNDLYNFDPKSSSRSFATPRSWTFVSNLISGANMDEETTSHLVSGAIGEGLGLKFMAHRKYASKMPLPADILSGKAKTMETKEISAMHSLVISMCYELKEAIDEGIDDNSFQKMADNFFRFMMDNFETELVVMGARVALATYKLPLKPAKLKNFDEFHKKYGHYILNTGD